jgi:hypothetical protein
VRHGWSALTFKENCSISLIGDADTSVEFGGLESSLMKNSGNKQTKKTSIKWRKFSSIGHTLRKSDPEPCKAALVWNPQGYRKRGRPRNSWWRSTNRKWVQKLEGVETYHQRQEKMEGSHRQPMFLMERRTFYYYRCHRRHRCDKTDGL